MSVNDASSKVLTVDGDLRRQLNEAVKWIKSGYKKANK